MTRGERAALIGGIAYAVVGLVCFGRSAAATYREETAQYVACQTDPKALCFDDRTVMAGTGGLMAALFWPFYLSWEAQS